MADIRQLIEETNAQPKYELPGWGAWAYGHPGVLTHGTKSPERYDQDMRRAYFIEQAKARLPKAEFMRIPLGGDNEAARLESLKSPYQRYGGDDTWAPALGEGAPLNVASKWWGAMPAGIYAIGQQVANEIDPEANPYPNAKADYDRAMNMLTGSDWFKRGDNPMHAAAQARARQDAIPWDAGGREDYRRLIESASAYSPKSGSEYIAESGATFPGYRLLGGLMDATVDPFFSRPRALGEAVMDYGIGTMHETVPAASSAFSYIRPDMFPSANGGQ